jgi:hypothetical protein
MAPVMTEPRRMLTTLDFTIAPPIDIRRISAPLDDPTIKLRLYFTPRSRAMFRESCRTVPVGTPVGRFRGKGYRNR